jgi:hypothetical protein
LGGWEVERLRNWEVGRIASKGSEQRRIWNRQYFESLKIKIKIKILWESALEW